MESLHEPNENGLPLDSSRRAFLKAGTGLTIAVAFGGVGLGFPNSAEASAAYPGLVTSWLNVSPANVVSLTIGTTEMGQGSRSGLAQVIAEDLCVNLNAVVLLQGGATLAYTGSNAVSRGYATSTGGSGAVRNNFWALRDAATQAREMLVFAAMDLCSDTARANYTTANAAVTHIPSATRYTYGQLADLASTKASLVTAFRAPDVPFSSLSVIGKSVARADIPAKLTGRAVYGVDVMLKGMVFAVVKHCPTFGGKLAATPATPKGAIAAVPLAVHDFTFVDPTKNYASSTFLKLTRGLEVSGNQNAVAVVAADTWNAINYANALAPTWTLPAAAASLNDAQFMADGMALASQSTLPSTLPGTATASCAAPAATLYTVEGTYAEAEPAVASAAQVVDVTYTLPYVAHAAMEVLSCTVDYRPGVSCMVYAPTQVQQNALKLVFLLLRQLGDTVVAPITNGIWDTSRIQIITTLLGGALGRKLEVDFISQAVQTAYAVAKLAAGPRPVKLMWTREQDFTHDQYRPMAVIHARAGINGTGNTASIAGWQYRAVSPSIGQQRGSVLNSNPATGVVGDSQGSEGARDLPYALGAPLVEYVTHPAQVPLGYWRSVGASINVFAVESFMDELAVAAGADPYQFRRQQLLATLTTGGTNAATAARWLAVLDSVATLGAWGKPAAGNFQGIAIGAAFNSIIAMVVELSATATTVKVRKVSVALDSYLVVNPDSAVAQMQGGVVHALNATLYGRQSFVNGVAQRTNFNTYRMIRADQMPEVQVVITQPDMLTRTSVIGGVGELGVPTLAPALAHAFFRATGKRTRSLPLFG